MISYKLLSTSLFSLLSGIGLETEEIKPADNLLQLQHSEALKSSSPPAYNVGHFYLPITVSVEHTSTKSLQILKPVFHTDRNPLAGESLFAFTELTQCLHTLRNITAFQQFT